MSAWGLRNRNHHPPQTARALLFKGVASQPPTQAEDRQGNQRPPALSLPAAGGAGRSHLATAGSQGASMFLQMTSEKSKIQITEKKYKAKRGMGRETVETAWSSGEAQGSRCAVPVDTNFLGAAGLLRVTHVQQ